MCMAEGDEELERGAAAVQQRGIRLEWLLLGHAPGLDSHGHGMHTGPHIHNGRYRD